MAAAVVMTSRPLFLQNATNYTALDLRALIDVPYFEGVDGQASFNVNERAAGTNMSVDVNGGRAVIIGNSPSGSRYYMVADDNEIAANVPLDPAPASNSRIDLIIARVRDAAVGGGLNNDWTLEAVSGTVASTPVAPAVPNNAIELAQVTVAAGTAAVTESMITQRQTDMNRVGSYFNSRPAQVTDGQLISDYGTNRLYQGRGGEWVDINALSMELTSRAGGSLFGGTPPPNTVYKWEAGTKGVGFLEGDANVVFEHAFSGLMFFSATAIGNSKTIPISRRTNHSAVLNGSQVPVYGLDCNVFGNAVLNGTVTVNYYVVGW